MSDYTSFSKDTALSTIFGVAPTLPAQFYLGLFDTNNAPSPPSGELTAVDGYARQLIDFTVTGTIGVGDMQAVSSGDITFSALGACSVASFGIFDAASAGNLWYWGDFDSATTVTMGDDVTILDTAITIGHT
jgi:hypothetical protein